MRNTYLFSILMTILIVSTISAVGAKTTIAGKIYTADFKDTVAGANVVIDCKGNIQTFTSLSDGAYSVNYEDNQCTFGDSLTVSAEKNGMYGSKTGEIHDDFLESGWDLAIVNVPLVPEFSTIIGIATILGSVGIFFFVRRE